MSKAISTGVQGDPLVVWHSDTKCSYKCGYYQDGPVISLCNKYHKPLKYDGTIPPLLLDECKQSGQVNHP